MELVWINLFNYINRYNLPTTEWCQRYLPCIVSCQPASDVSEKFGSTFRVRTVLAREMTELIPTVKMETKNPVILVVNFRRSVIIVKLWRSDVARRSIFFRNVCIYFGITTSYGKNFKILFQEFLSQHVPIDVLLQYCVWRTDRHTQDDNNIRR